MSPSGVPSRPCTLMHGWVGPSGKSPPLPKGRLVDGRVRVLGECGERDFFPPTLAGMRVGDVRGGWTLWPLVVR